MDGNDRRAGQERPEVDEVAGFTEDSPAPFVRVTLPMVIGKAAGVDAQQDVPPARQRCQVRLRGEAQRRETPIEPDLEKSLGPAGGGNHLLEIFPRQSQRLFDEDMFAGIQGADGLAGVQAVRCGQQDRVDVGIAENCVFVGACAAKAEALLAVLGGDTARRDNGTQLAIRQSPSTPAAASSAQRLRAPMTPRVQRFCCVKVRPAAGTT